MPDLKSELSKLTDLHFDDDSTQQPTVIESAPASSVIGDVRRTITLDSPITDLDLTVRAMNVLREYRVFNVRELTNKTPRELLKMKSMGAKSVKEIEWALSQHSLHLGMKHPELMNFQQRVWHYVKDHPGCTARDLGKAFGLNYKQPSSRLFQLYTRGALTRTEQPDGSFRWFASADTYPLQPVGSNIKAAHAAKRRGKEQPSGTIELAAAPPTSKKIDIDSVLNTLSVREARHLYDELKKIFGA